MTQTWTRVDMGMDMDKDTGHGLRESVFCHDIVIPNFRAAANGRGITTRDFTLLCELKNLSTFAQVNHLLM